MRQRLDVLAVIGGAHSGNESEQQRDQWRFLFLAPGLIKDLTSGAGVPPQRLDPGYDAILTVGKPLDAMVAGGAERTFAGAASRACGVGWMEDTVHLGVHLSLRFGCFRRVSRFGRSAESGALSESRCG